MANISIRSAFSRKATENRISEEITNLVIPGEFITGQQNFTRGHGVFIRDEKIFASLPGSLQQVNKLITVNSLKTRYTAHKGDVIVGRIIEVSQKRWKVDINTNLDALLNLSAINLPTGEQRRKCDEDEKWMRQYLCEGDLISAEVMDVNSGGMVNIQIRSSIYGKLGQGVLMKISPSLIKKRKSHMHSLTCGANIILGNNGYIWIAPSITGEVEKPTGFEQDLEPVAKSDREVIARLRNCILALAEKRVHLYDSSITYAYDASSEYQVKEILLPEVVEEIVHQTRMNLAK